MLSILAQNGFANSLLLCVGLRVYCWISMRQLLLTRLAGISVSVSAVGGKCADLGRKWVCSYGVLVIILTCWRLEIRLGAHGCCLIQKSAVCNYIPLLRFSVCCRMTKIDLIWIDIKNVYEIFCHPFLHLLDFTSVTLICQFRLPHHLFYQPSITIAILIGHGTCDIKVIHSISIEHTINPKPWIYCKPLWIKTSIKCIIFT